MTFSVYVQNLGFLLAQWLPICGLMYLAVRLGIEHATKHVMLSAMRAVESSQRPRALTEDQRARIGEP